MDELEGKEWIVGRKTSLLVANMLFAYVLATTDGAHGTSSMPQFGSPVILTDVPGEIGEPSILAGPGGAIYVGAPDLAPTHTAVWRSVNGGNSFLADTSPPGWGGDIDIAGDTAHLYVAELFTGGGSEGSGSTEIPVSVSLDGGATYAWTRKVDSSGSSNDRQWIAVGPGGEVYVTWLYQLNELRMAVSRDAGLSYSSPVTIATPVSQGGPVSVAGDGTVLVPYWENRRMWVARSADQGRSWSSTSIPPVAGHGGAGTTAFMDQPFGFPVVAVGGSRVYAVYSYSRQPEGTGQVVLSVSVDTGRTFSRGAVVSEPSRGAIFPWVVAGAHGAIAIFYLASTFMGEPNFAPPSTEWTVDLAFSNVSSGPFGWSKASPGTIHRGSVCTLGPNVCQSSGLSLPLDWRLRDFFEATADASGNLLVSYTADAQNEPMSGSTNIVFQRQVSGPRLIA